MDSWHAMLEADPPYGLDPKPHLPAGRLAGDRAAPRREGLTLAVSKIDISSETHGVALIRVVEREES
jgi:hypothetical protein